MDRLQVVGLAALVGVLAGCSPELYSDPKQAGKGKDATARFNAVRATTPVAVPESWCEVSYKPGEGPQLTLPALATDLGVPADGAPATVAADRWTWLNLWATWCMPCVGEMGQLGRWQKRLGDDKLAVDFWLLSLDDNAAATRRFFATHRDVPVGPRLRINAVDDIATWLPKYGLDAQTAIPVHLLIAPGGEVRCVRVGSVSEGDWVKVRGLIARG